ncbi:hypothetical protein TSTA_108770 [Talaromyces stipitatus ATCC 10500]|uniref:Zn(2)-C6 fungal-type domain-containing protein n=1 Tax=Talaromyces stipitatus (strain ATCC 10500 / CBS 375.48 / QM 6759 / NRRL 1006) TaxID=441959 RepID=B8MUM5_TALSN|nr:uncharacterized protein TSTA_108770 [Talaromyces stipitatus ATCC 10500]EED11693.1 hypothetical protein TSTA_108770 [Talaromyces stipitatus ATCC 10500]
MSGSGILAQWQARHAVLVVPMGGVQFLSFQQQPAIGTRDLGSCSVVLIASAQGAILAHIPPRPLQPSPDPFAGDNNARNMMNQVATLYQQNRGYFSSADSVVVCAWYNGAVALPEQTEIMSSSLRQLGLNPTIRTYHVPGNRNLPGQGTVIAIKSANQPRPQIYVEDRHAGTVSAIRHMKIERLWLVQTWISYEYMHSQVLNADGRHILGREPFRPQPRKQRASMRQTSFHQVKRTKITGILHQSNWLCTYHPVRFIAHRIPVSPDGLVINRISMRMYLVKPQVLSYGYAKLLPTMSSATRSRQPRAARACDRCRQAHMRCCQKIPCQRCQKLNVSCHYQPTQLIKQADKATSTLEDYPSYASTYQTWPRPWDLPLYDPAMAESMGDLARAPACETSYPKLSSWLSEEQWRFITMPDPLDPAILETMRETFTKLSSWEEQWRFIMMHDPVVFNYASTLPPWGYPLDDASIPETMGDLARATTCETNDYGVTKDEREFSAPQKSPLANVDCHTKAQEVAGDLVPSIASQSKLRNQKQVVGAIDWEYTYSAPLEFVYSAPFWLLLELPEYWPEGLDDWTNIYETRLVTFLRVLEEREKVALERGLLAEEQRLSTYMRDSWESGDFWVNYAARKSWAFDMIYWAKIDRRFFGDGYLDDRLQKDEGKRGAQANRLDVLNHISTANHGPFKCRDAAIIDNDAPRVF